MKQLTYLYLSLLALYILSSCRKDLPDFSGYERKEITDQTSTGSPNTPSTVTLPAQNSVYYSSQLKNIGSVRLFTKDGEITNAQIISSFISRLGTENEYLKIGGTTESYTFLDAPIHAMFLSGNKCNINGSEPTFFSTLDGKVEKLADAIKITDSDTLTESFSEDDLLLYRVVSGLRKYTPKYELKTTISADELEVKTLSELYLTNNGAKLDMPFVCGLYKREQGSNGHLEEYFQINNKYNGKGHANLSIGDTLAIQEYTVTLSRN